MNVVKYSQDKHDDDAGVYARARERANTGGCVLAGESVFVNMYTYEEKNAWMPLIV